MRVNFWTQHLLCDPFFASVLYLPTTTCKNQDDQLNTRLPHMAKSMEACFGRKRFPGCRWCHLQGDCMFHQQSDKQILPGYMPGLRFLRHAVDYNVGASAFLSPNKQVREAPVVCAISPACPRNAQANNNTIKTYTY